jgi:hypothetical protein
MATVKAEINSWPEVSFEEISPKPVSGESERHQTIGFITRFATARIPLATSVQAAFLFSQSVTGIQTGRSRKQGMYNGGMTPRDSRSGGDAPRQFVGSPIAPPFVPQQTGRNAMLSSVSVLSFRWNGKGDPTKSRYGIAAVCWERGCC